MKIKMKDGTEYLLHENSTENMMILVLGVDASVTDVLATLSESNLSEFSIISEEDVESAIYKDKELVLPAQINAVDDTYLLSVNLKDVDMIQKRIRLLEDTVDFLLLNTLEPKEESGE